MKKLIVLSLCCIFTLHAMEEGLSNGVFISQAEEKDIPAMTSLSNEVISGFFKPMIHEAYAEYGEEAIAKCFSEFDSYYDGFFKRATARVENNSSSILVALHQDAPDKVLGLCGFTKKEAVLFIEYLIISQQLRGKGIGKALLEQAIATHDHIETCRLYTFARNNQATQAFYEKFGFTSTKELLTGLQCMQNTHIMYQMDIKK